MKVITRKQIASEVKNAFYRQYGPKFPVYPFGDTRKIYEALVALGDDPSIDDVEALCKGWTKLSCNECRRYVDCAVELGEPQDYESRTATICLDCLKRAIEISNPADTPSPTPHTPFAG